MSPPYRPLPPLAPRRPLTPLPSLEPPRLTRLDRLKRYCSNQRVQCRIRTIEDGLLVCAVIQIVLAFASVILSTVKVIICGINHSAIWSYAFFLAMIFSGVVTGLFVKSKTELVKYAAGIVFVSLMAVAITTASLSSIGEKYTHYRQGTFKKDYFCHDGHTWTEYVNSHYFTALFIEATGGLTAVVQGFLALRFAAKFGLFQRRNNDVTEEAAEDEQTTDLEEEDEHAQSENEDESDEQVTVRHYDTLQMEPEGSAGDDDENRAACVDNSMNVENNESQVLEMDDLHQNLGFENDVELVGAVDWHPSDEGHPVLTDNRHFQQQSFSAFALQLPDSEVHPSDVVPIVSKEADHPNLSCSADDVSLIGGEDTDLKQQPSSANDIALLDGEETDLKQQPSSADDIALLDGEETEPKQQPSSADDIALQDGEKRI